jgi:hypothetical protein
MSPTDTFTIFLNGSSELQTVAAGQAYLSNLEITVPFYVMTVALPNGTNGVAYNQTLAAFGGQPPYSWTNISGALPPGLTLATNGVISGTPTNSGMFYFTVQVTDAASNTATQLLTLMVGSPPGVALPPMTNSVPVGSNVIISVSVVGTGPNGA